MYNIKKTPGEHWLQTHQNQDFADLLHTKEKA